MLKTCKLPALLLALAPLALLGAGHAGPHAADHAAIPFDAAEVTRDDGRGYVITWHSEGVRRVRVYAGTDPLHIGHSHAVSEGAAAGHVTVSNLPEAPRWYFELVPDRGTALVVAERSLNLSTAANFRDAGGYRTVDGRWVRTGLVYRSNGIEHLTDAELDQVAALNIKLVCDLRTAYEIDRNPDRVPKGAADVSADVLADDAELIHGMMTGTGPPMSDPQVRRDFELRIYRDFVRLPSAQKAYRELFERLADPDALPTVFHCTAGKDRTGWAEAVFLSILGVPRPTIVHDYELTNEYLRGAALESVRRSMNQSGAAAANGAAANGAAASAAVTANPASLDAAFDEVTQDYGSFENYLHEGLRLDDSTLNAIRKNFLTG